MSRRGEQMDTRTRPTAHAGVVLAIVLGALPAATVGLDVAWVVVASGIGALLIAPVLARRQVNAITAVELPEQVVVHAGRTSNVRLDLEVSRRARHVLVDMTRTDARPTERERAPRLALAAVVATDGDLARVDAPLRIPVRGRTNALAVTLESTYPFGLFRSEARVVERCETVVLPRVLRRGDRALEVALAAVGSGDDLASRRPVPRGPGLPAAFRPSRRDDTARDVAWRPSARRMRWISMDRTPATADRMTVVLVAGVRGARSSNARRARAAFEAAVSVCATAVDRLTREGHEVTLRLASPDPDSSLAEVATTRSTVLSQSVRALPHLLALTDVVPAVEPSEGEQRRSRRAPELIVFATATTRAAPDGESAPASRVLLVDANGQTALVDAARGRRRLAGVAR